MLFALLLLGMQTGFAQEEGEPVEPPYPYEDLRSGDPIPTEDFTGELFKMLAVLGLILGGMLLVSWLIRYMMNMRMEQANVTSEIKILERRMISPKSSVYLIDIHGARFAVSESLNGITLLGSVEHPDFKQVLENLPVQKLPDSFQS